MPWPWQRPGEVSKNNDRIIASVGNMPKDYMNTPFKELSEKPVVVENDANAAMWAEYRLGAAKGRKMPCWLPSVPASASVLWLTDSC